MKIRITAVLLVMIFLLGCAGCALFETEYTYSEPFVDSLDREDGNATEVSNYNMLKGAILDMINRHEESAELRFSNYNGVVSDDLASVCLEIKTSNPLGAYAVDTLNYDSSRIVSYYIAEIDITYSKTEEQLRRIHNVNNAAELKAYLQEEVLKASLPTAVVRVYQSQTDAPSVEQMLEQIFFEDPVEIPLPVQGKVQCFPNEGSNRIYEISLQYARLPAQRSAMSETMRERVAELSKQADSEEPAQRAFALAQLLSSGLTEPDGENPGTAYGALAEGYANSRGIALAYNALCRASEIDCIVVKGNIGSMGTEEHYWNIIKIGGDYYHVDVSQFIFDPAYAFLVSDSDIWGTYIWNTEEYPDCVGELRYRDVLPDTESTGQISTAEPEPQMQPEEPTDNSQTQE